MIQGFLRSTFVCAALSLAAPAACLAQTTDLSADFWPHDGCTVGDVRHAGIEHWVSARGLARTNKPEEQVYTVFDDNGPASAMRVVLSEGAIRSINRVEVQDAQGAWTQVWSGRYRDALPAGCTNVWFEHSLAGPPKLFTAIRLGFVLEQPNMVVGAAGLRKAQ